MYIYYGLTKEEKTNQKVIYKKNDLYDGKAVNLNLKGLKEFIKDENMESIIKYYSKIPIKKFRVIKAIIKDKKYDMITVEIPFEIEFKKAYKINWRK
jgi:hypothetical protein